MNLSKKSRYGITALIDLAVYARNQCVQLSSIAERNKISVKYLEQIFPMMGIRFIAINDNYDNANSESSDSDSIALLASCGKSKGKNADSKDS